MAQAITAVNDPDEPRMKYWITSSIPSTWVIQAQGEQDPELGGGFLIMRMLDRTTKQFSVTCHWYETGYGPGYRRTSFQVTVDPDDMMWPIYQKSFANPKDKGRWLQALGAACMFKTPTATTQRVLASATGYRPQELPSVRIVPARVDGLWTVIVKSAK